MVSNIFASASLVFALFLIHPSITASYPKSVGETYTYPHLDTVAGEALFKFSTSNTNLQFSVIAIRSPLANVNILLSSNTVFRFSIQIASTGPSQVSQVWCFKALLLDLDQIVENVMLATFCVVLAPLDAS